MLDWVANTEGQEREKRMMRATLDHLLVHPPDKEWLVNVLGLIDPQNEVFAKCYVPPKDQAISAKIGP